MKIWCVGVGEAPGMENTAWGASLRSRTMDSYSKGLRVTARWSPAGTWMWGSGRNLTGSNWSSTMASQRVMGVMGTLRMSEITRERLGQSPGQSHELQ